VSRLGSGLLTTILFASGLAAQTANEIKTPFQLVPLWSGDMLEYLRSDRAPACSGPTARCERLSPGVCDDTVHFTFNPFSNVEPPARDPLKQSGAVDPQYFRPWLRNAYSYHLRVFYFTARTFDRLEFVFNCSARGSSECDSGHFQTGAVNRVELSRRGDSTRTDLTRSARVLPEGPIVIPIDAALKASLVADADAVYELRVAAQCFSVAQQTGREWSMPLHASPDSATTIGALVARITPETDLTFAYRAPDGKDIAFEPDWVGDADFDSSTFVMDQTILDRRGEWYLLPARPFPTPVWVRLPARRSTSKLEPKVTYTLSSPMQAVRTTTKRTVTLAAGNYVVVRLLDRALEIREEEPADSPCADRAAPPRRNPPVYRVALADVYDEARHLRLTPVPISECEQ
jgi:hypothetical protein